MPRKPGYRKLLLMFSLKLPNIPAPVRASGSRGMFGGAIVLGLLLSLIAPENARAQTALPSLRGSVVDSAGGAPLPNAQVIIRLPGQESVITGAVTDQSGRFTIPAIAPGRYSLTFSYLGYAPHTTAVEVGAGAVTVPRIALLRQAIELADLTVVAERSAVVMAADRDIYSVGAIAAAAGGSATDVLQNIPDLQVEVDGTVTLHGEAPTIYINGRPTPMTGEALAMFLQGFAAENIESVEVMQNPSSRFEAQGSGGIVNIVLRRGASLGLTGNAFANGGSRGEMGLGGRATWQQDAWRITGGSNLRLTQTETNTSELRENLSTQTSLEQYALADRQTWNGNFDFDVEYSLGSETTLSADSRIGLNASDASRVTTYRELDATELLIDEYQRSTIDDASGLSSELALEFEHEFSDEHELELALEYENGRDFEQSLIRQRILEDLGVLDEATELTEDEDRETETEVSLQADYIRPMGERGQLELGFQSEYGSTDERRWQQVSEESTAGAGEALRTGFEHSQAINSLYLTLMRRLGDFNAQLGVRAEHSNTTLGLEAGDVDVRDLSVFPNANLTYNLGEGKRIRGSYSVRIERPSSNVLNPTNTSDDPLNLRTGNPDINSQLTHSFTIAASWAGQLGSIRLSPFYRVSIDEWERIKTVNEVTGVSNTTYANVGSTTTFGSSINLSLRDFMGIGGSINLSARHQINDWDLAMNRNEQSSTRWRLQTNLNGRVSSDLSLQGSLAYNPARDLPQGRTSATVMTRVGLRQRVLSGRGSVNLNVTDPFEQYRPRTVTSDVNFSEQGRDRASIRAVTLSFSYNFGARSQNAQRGAPGGGGDRDGAPVSVPGGQVGDGPRGGGGGSGGGGGGGRP